MSKVYEALTTRNHEYRPSDFSEPTPPPGYVQYQLRQALKDSLQSLSRAEIAQIIQEETAQ